MTNYKDMLKKAQFYKKQILNSFIKHGYFPSNEEINNALQDVDTRSALLETYISTKGSYFNTKEINYMFECIYKDLTFLYEILEDILLNDYNKLKLDTEAYLLELESKALNLKNRMNEEVNSTALGTTIFFKSNGWETITVDNITTINLGKMDLIQGSELAVFANINNITADSIYFKFEDDSNNNNNFNALPYNYNENTYTVPGELSINKYDLTLNGNLIVNGNIEINLDNVDDNNMYKILGGKNLMKVTYKDNNVTEYISFATNDKPFYTDKECYIEFFLLNGTNVAYDFNQKPNHTNFSLNDGTISSNSKVTKIFIDAPSNFACRFVLETGEVWASYTDALIKDKKHILYTGSWDLRDFLILEYVRSKKTSYNISVVLNSNEEIVKYINNIYIKEIE